MVRLKAIIVQSSPEAVSGLQLRHVEGGKTRMPGSKREGHMPVPTLITRYVIQIALRNGVFQRASR